MSRKDRDGEGFGQESGQVCGRDQLFGWNGLQECRSHILRTRSVGVMGRTI